MVTINGLFEQIGWLGLVEIISISTIFYYISRWLSRDKKKKLLFYFYSYSLISGISFFLELPLIWHICSYYSPVFMMLFIIVHRETLQKNFIALQTYKPAQKASYEWHNELMRCILVNQSKGIKLNIIIEQTDNLDELLVSPFIINTPFQAPLMQTLITSTLFNQDKSIWLRSDGTLVSINTELKRHPTMIIDEQIQELSTCQQDALILSKTTDSLFISNDISNHNFMIISRETIKKNLSAENCLKIVKKQTMRTSPKGTSRYGKKKQTEQQTHSS